MSDNVPKNQNLQILPMEKADIQTVVELHRRLLGDSVNSRLGPGHLAYIYEVASEDPSSMVMVAHQQGVCAGVVSATVDPEELKRRLLRRLTVFGWMKLFFNILRHPSALAAWFDSRDLGRPVIYAGVEVKPCITAMAVDNRFRNAGIGRALVSSVEDFCRCKGYSAFRLDTREKNEVSRIFYKKLGFVEIEKRGKNIMLVKSKSI